MKDKFGKQAMNMGKKQTFIIEIQDTQCQSWQGNVEWIQGQKKQSFRSVIELLKLMDSAIGKEEIQWDEQP